MLSTIDYTNYTIIEEKYRTIIKKTFVSIFFKFNRKKHCNNKLMRPEILK